MTRSYLKKDLTDFLMQSNFIEGVYDSASYHQANEAWKFLKDQKRLTTGVILKVHKILMLNQDLMPNEKGYFRTIPVYIGGKEAMNALQIPETIKQWIVNFNDIIENGKKESEIFLENIVKQHHIKYEEIHPFVDGNGRTGRLFWQWQRIKVGLPFQVIWEKDRQDYYKWFI